MQPRLSSLGEGYREEDLRRIISGEDVASKQRKVKRSEKSFDMLLDIQEIIAKGKGDGYERWAKVYNIKQVVLFFYFRKSSAGLCAVFLHAAIPFIGMFKGDWGIPQLAEDAWGAHPCTARQFVKHPRITCSVSRQSPRFYASKNFGSLLRAN